MTTQGFDVGAQERLTNVRYAGDLLVYAKWFPELVCTIELLCEELGKVSLQLNGAKTIFSQFAWTRLRPLLMSKAKKWKY